MSPPRREEFYRRLAEQAGLQYVRLDPVAGEDDAVDPAAARLLESVVARTYGVVVVRAGGGRLSLALSDPRRREAAVLIRALTGLEVDLVVASPGAITRAQDRVYDPTPERARAVPAAWSREERVRYQTLAGEAGLQYSSLEPGIDAEGRVVDPVDPNAVALVPAEVSRRYRVLAISATADVVVLATSDPADEATLRLVHALTEREVRLVITAPGELDAAIARSFRERFADEPEGPLQPAEARRRLGELLVTAGLVTDEQVASALRAQERYGGRIGELLLHARAASEGAIASAVAEQHRLPFIEMNGIRPDSQALSLIPEPVARRHRFVPLSIHNHALYLAVAEPLDDEAIANLREHTKLPLRPLVAPRSDIERVLQRVYSQRYVRVATAELLNRSPEESAYRVLTFPQKVFFGLLAAIGFLFLFWAPIATIVVFNIVSVVFYTAFSLYKFKLIYGALAHELELPVTAEEVAALEDRDLPTYSILVPLFREAAMVPQLLESLNRLDYPRIKLDVKLIVEEDDQDTIEALAFAELPAQFRLVVVPAAQPKTKPKACNYGLIQAEGKYVVIYDAEDVPERDQLKKIVVAYTKAEDRIVCIQCKLNYFNRSQNILTRWFTTEYSNWFDLFMPGLDAADAPIPLGGTSNHFIREKLIELGAWDPFNVTEDADLGIRLHKAGYKTAIIDSTTFEEANSDLYNWIRQRSRWVKGYIQTWLVHMRHPLRLKRQVGWASWFSFQFVVGGTFFSFLLNPLYWILTSFWLLTQAGVIRSLFPGVVYYTAAFALYVGNFVFAYVNVAGSLRRGYNDLVKYALLSPLYWTLMSIGAWKGLLQLMYRPYYWEKTVHGLDVLPPEHSAVLLAERT